MPTGYTKYIEDNTITTGTDFLKLCTRNFGVSVDVKDCDLSVATPEHAEVDPCYEKIYRDCLEKKNRYRKMSLSSAKQDMCDHWRDKTANAKQILDRYLQSNQKYLKIRKEIEEWIPPTKEHIELKQFALKQIDISMCKKTDIEFYKKRMNEELNLSDAEVKRYLSENISLYEQETIEAYQAWQEQVKQAEERTLWMKQFLKSLENINANY